jgi:hypothetical protein
MKKFFKFNRFRKSQNIVEIVLIIPLMVLIMLALLEYGLFQRNVNAIQDIAVEASIAASKQYVSESIVPGDPFTENPAVAAAIKIIGRRLNSLNLVGLTFNFTNFGPAFGKRPFALYQFESTKKITYKGKQKPMVIFNVDYRNPIQDGVSVQLIYYYNLVLFGAEISVPGGPNITIIPRNIQISSTQTSQYINY